MTDEELKKAAENYIAPIENDEGLDYINFSGRDIKDAFIAGAEWQKAKMPMPEDTVLFNKGVEEGKRLAEEEQAELFTIVALDAAQRAKEQMMKEAVEVMVTSNLANNPIIYFDDAKKLGLKYGDKVRIIIVKEEK